jgi:hypothetical protein
MKRWFILAFLIAATPAFAGKGYMGLFAPSEDEGKAKTEQQPPVQPQGYSGVIPGAVPSAPAPVPAPSTPAPATPAAVKNGDDLRAAAGVHGILAPDVPRTLKKTFSSSGQKSPRIGGLLPTEYNAKMQIQKIMQAVQEPNFNKEQRAELIKLAAEKLAKLGAGYRARNGVPDAALLRAGASETFIREERDGTSGALNRVNAALEELQKLQ